jgi:uncharacterized protein YbjQ (UPF0145 family)
MPDETDEQLESLARIEQGGIPLSAVRRLSQLRERGRSFTSELSVGGFALCDQLGLRVLSQVMGSSVYQMGYQSSWGPMELGGPGLVELDTLSEALNEVRGRALVRMAEEARHVGADLVIGVNTRATESEQSGSLVLEHRAVGTAVGDGRDRGGSPVLTELSVADYAKLRSAGYEPLGIVAWSSVFFASYAFAGMLGAPGQGMLGGVQNYELREFTQAVYGARETVMSRISDQAASLGAAGVVGVKIAHTVQRRQLGGMAGREASGVMVTFEAIGTAIHEHGGATPLVPEPVIDLYDRQGA